jgi:hypothetical protein
MQNGAPDFERDCTSALTAFHTNSRGFKTTYDHLSAKKGLDYYDQRDLVERLLREIIELHKELLIYLDKLVDSIPGIGPVLGPSMSPLLPLILLRLLTDLH